MARTEEGVVKDKIKKLLNEFDVYFHMVVQNGLGAPSLDFICCHNGRYFAIEAKKEGAKATPRQEVTMNEMRAAGAFVFLVSCDAELMKLRVFLELTQK